LGPSPGHHFVQYDDRDTDFEGNDKEFTICLQKDTTRKVEHVIRSQTWLVRQGGVQHASLPIDVLRIIKSRKREKIKRMALDAFGGYWIKCVDGSSYFENLPIALTDLLALNVEQLVL